MTTLEVLQKARGFIADPIHWVHGWGTMNQKGEGYACAVGAVRASVGLSSYPSEDIYDGNKDAQRATQRLAAVIGEKTGWDVVGYNDEHDHDCVIAMFDAAIEREKQKAAK